MTEEEWLACGDALRMAELPNLKSQTRKFRLFSGACCRQLAPWFSDPIVWKMINASERYADDRSQAAVLDRWQRQAERARDSLPRVAGQGGVTPEWVCFHAVACLCTPYHYTSWQMVAQHLLLHNDAFRLEFYVELNRQFVHFLRDIFGNPFRPMAFDPRWRSESAVALARTAYDTRDFALLPILADALEEAGCDNTDVLNHCRDPNGVHVRGCWVVDGVLGHSEVGSTR